MADIFDGPSPSPWWQSCGYEVRCDDNVLVATVALSPMPRMMANTRLIAAAPDLLAACEDLLPLALAHLQSLTEDMPAEEDDTDERLPHPDKWELSRRWYSASAAIAKARGGEGGAA